MLPEYMVDSRKGEKYCRTYSNLAPEEKLLLDRADDAQLLCEISDGGSYGYDDWALIELDGLYYIVNTSGCSCPDPADTWYIVRGGTKQDIILELNGPNGINKRFRNAVAKLAGWEAVNTPEPRKSYDW